MSIPREDLYAIVCAPLGTVDAPPADEDMARNWTVTILAAVAASLRDRSTAAADARKKGWKGESERLFAIAQEVEAYAAALAGMELDGTPAVMTAEAEPTAALHDNQCAALEPPPYINAVRQRCVLTAVPQHTGKHVGDKGTAWPSTTGQDIAAEVIVPQQRATKQIKAAGDGYEIVTTAAVAVLDRPADYCAQCDTGTHVCPGSGEPTAHDGSHACTHPECSFYTAPAPLSPADQFMADLGQPIPAGPMPTGVPHDLESLVVSYPIISGTALSGPSPRSAALDLFAPVGGTPKEHQSPSSIKTYANCGLKYRFTYREKIEGRPMWAGVGGTAYHSVVQEIDRAHALEGRFDPAGSAQQYETYASEVWRDTFAREIDKQAAQQHEFADPSKWYVANGGKEDQAWWWSNGEDMVRRYLHTRPAWHAEGWRLLGKPGGGVAQELEFTIVRAGVPIKGYIDDVWINAATGNLRIRDLKSGARKEESDFQLRVYGAALRDLGVLGTETDRKVTGAYFMARKGEHDQVLTLSAKDDAVIAYRAGTTAHADLAEVFAPNPSSYCGACPFRRVCPAA